MTEAERATVLAEAISRDVNRLTRTSPGDVLDILRALRLLAGQEPAPVEADLRETAPNLPAPPEPAMRPDTDPLRETF